VCSSDLYAAGSPFDTDFWSYAKERGIKKIESLAHDQRIKNIYSNAKSLSGFHLANSQIPEYGLWWAGSFAQNFDGLGLLDTIDKILK
jgi:hypothetical protein